ncbi:ABC transporter permease [Demequina sp. NBRC 110052]|uniref:ABC transporter permease n=1 Tax=Demequina sp. NBRC 110052 TaxID=1570341 RepID=UPI000A05790B|nr:ABC transporter permease [Demequina sp. NBRC 110052]
MPEQSVLEATTVPTAPSGATKPRSRRVLGSGVIDSLVVAGPLVAIVIVAWAIAPNFMTGANISNILSNAALLAIVGFGMTLAITVRGIDLSVGSAQAFAACVTGISVNSLGVVPGILIGLLAGVVVGALNGMLVTLFAIPAFVATLATMTAMRGVALLTTDGTSVYISDPHFTQLATLSFGGVELSVVVAILLGIGTWFLVRHTTLGKHILAVGGRPQAAAESGIRVSRVLLVVYVLAGLMVGIAAVLLSSRLAVVNGTYGVGLELQVIAIAVLGGTSLAGGRANVVGTAIAALLLATVNSTLNLLNVPSYWQYVAVGLILLAALSVDGIRRMSKSRTGRASQAGGAA